MKIKGPFLKIVMFDRTLGQLKKSFAPIKTQNQKIQWFNLDFLTFILIIKHNLP
jgi:hypothetical protein